MDVQLELLPPSELRLVGYYSLWRKLHPGKNVLSSFFRFLEKQDTLIIKLVTLTNGNLFQLSRYNFCLTLVDSYLSYRMFILLYSRQY